MAEISLVVEKVGDIVIATMNESSLLAEGQIDSAARQLYALIDERAILRLIVDFSRVKFLSSRMLGVLVELHKKAQAIGGKVVLCGLSDELGKIFRITGLGRVVHIARDTGKASRMLRD